MSKDSRVNRDFRKYLDCLNIGILKNFVIVKIVKTIEIFKHIETIKNDLGSSK